jgi:hypothetical protein
VLQEQQYEVNEMAGGFVICEYESVKSEFPEFNAVMERLRTSLIAKAEKDWRMRFAGSRKITEAAALGVSYRTPGPGLEVRSGEDEFGETTILPALFGDRLGTRLTTWHQWYGPALGMTIPGSNVIMSGVVSGNIPEDYKVGLAGLVFLDKAIRVSEIKMQISDKKLPRINVEEAFGYNKPAVLFEDGYILDEEKGFELIGYLLTQGPQRIKLLGLQVNRVKDKVLTNTGAALT